MFYRNAECVVFTLFSTNIIILFLNLAYTTYIKETQLDRIHCLEIQEKLYSIYLIY